MFSSSLSHEAPWMLLEQPLFFRLIQLAPHWRPLCAHKGFPIENGVFCSAGESPYLTAAHLETELQPEPNQLGAVDPSCWVPRFLGRPGWGAVLGRHYLASRDSVLGIVSSPVPAPVST